MQRSIHRISASIFLLCLPFCALTQADDSPLDDNVWALSLSELLSLKIETASKQPEVVTEIPASVTLITRQEIRDFGYQSLTDILSQVPGLYQIYSYRGIPGNFGLRGLWNPRKQNSSYAILINGVRHSQESDRSSPFSLFAMPVEAIDRIEVIRGPMSVTYGNGASFGVINIVTNNANSLVGEQLAAVSAGNFKHYRGAYRTTFDDGTKQGVINIGHYSTNGIEHPIRDMVTDPVLNSLPQQGINEPEKYTFDGRLERQQSYIDVSATYGSWQILATINQTKMEPFLVLPSVEEGNHDDIINRVFNLRYNAEVSESISIKSAVNYSLYDRDLTLDALYPGFEGSRQTNYESYQFESVLNNQINRFWQLMVGLNFHSMKGYSDASHLPDLGVNRFLNIIEDRSSHSLFSQVSYAPTQSLILSFGFRHESVDQHPFLQTVNTGLPEEQQQTVIQGGQTNTTPRFAAIYQPDDHQVIKFMTGEAAKIANERLPAESISTTEISYSYRKEYNEFTVSVFHNDLEDLLVESIVLLPDDTVSLEIEQSGKLTTTGVEFSGHIRFNSNWELALSATYQKSNDKSHPDGLASYSPSTLFKGKLSYRFEHGVWASNVRYVSGMRAFYDTTMTDGSGGFGAFVGEPVDSHTVVDTNLRFPDVIDRLSLNLKVHNLFKTDIRYPNNPDNNQLLNRGVLDQERQYSVSADYIF